MLTPSPLRSIVWHPCGPDHWTAAHEAGAIRRVRFPDRSVTYYLHEWSAKRDAPFNPTERCPIESGAVIMRARPLTPEMAKALIGFALLHQR